MDCATEHDLSQQLQILLFYQYSLISNPVLQVEAQRELCAQLGLYGRIRVASEGINVTLSGTPAMIQSYINIMKGDPKFEELIPSTIDFKISGPVKGLSLAQQQFQSLSCKVTKEVVSLDLSDNQRDAMLAAPSAIHLTPDQFHQKITDSLSPHATKDTILLDVRNFYETEIGRFECSNEEDISLRTVDPCTRQFSEFARNIDKMAPELSNKTILMYCTGGVRCERASAYLQSKGVTDLYQLYGGIHAYQQAFPHGGYFKGKNFVYDPRRAVPYEHKDEVIGRCVLCRQLYDDYAKQRRCGQCRVLLLVCDACDESIDARVEANELRCTYCRVKN